MKIASLRIRNFRGYRDSSIIKFDGLTAFIGKNDAGKSTILEALEIFFNVKKIDKGDVNVHCRKGGDTETRFNVCFTDLPNEVDIDAGGKTNLKDEYLLNAKGVKFTKKWTRDGKKGAKDCTLQTYIRNKIHHPENQEAGNIMYTPEELATSISVMRNLLTK